MNNKKNITPKQIAQKRAYNAKAQNKRKAQLQLAAKHHGFKNWSAMLTAIIRREWPL